MNRLRVLKKFGSVPLVECYYYYLLSELIVFVFVRDMTKQNSIEMIAENRLVTTRTGQLY